MNAVTSLNATCEREHIVRLFARFANRYGASWTGRLGNMSNWDDCIDDWYEDLKGFDYKTLVNAAKSALIVYEKFPPTFGQFEELCRKFSGFPQVDEVINYMINRDFSHPIVKMVYDKIGSWTLKTGKESEIQNKAKTIYAECLAEFTLNPQLAWEQLENHNQKPKELPAPSKIPSSSESKAFRECMNKCQEILKGKKIDGGGKTYRQFDDNKVKKGHKEFDQAIFNEYREYLMSIPETETMILPPVYLMERNKFLNMIDQSEWLKKQGYVPPRERQGFASHKTSDKKSGRGPQPIYKNWMND